MERNRKITIRVSDDELQFVKDTAEHLGVSIQQYLLHMIVDWPLTADQKLKKLPEAKLTGAVEETLDPDETLYFHLQVDGIEFKMGLSKMQECIKYAQDNGYACKSR